MYLFVCKKFFWIEIKEVLLNIKISIYMYMILKNGRENIVGLLVFWFVVIAVVRFIFEDLRFVVGIVRGVVWRI